MQIYDSCYCPDVDDRKNPLASPILASKDQLGAFPPTLIITAGKDGLCAEAERFGEMLNAAGVDVSHQRFDKAQHGFTLFSGNDSNEGWRLMIEHIKLYI